ncbi:Hpt domain-containing protein [Pontibacter locisalis]|uniref:Hpt domain-containing protein n=1 Tax=Pontibacter locisalis TaxID=1719035 RepID=A0ABW5IQW9_9BACT
MTIQANQTSDAGIPENVQQKSICNLDYLNRMSGGDSKFIKEMIRLFLKQVPMELEKLEKAAEAEDLTTAKQVAHKLKSSVAMVGAESMLATLKHFEVSEVEGSVKITLDLFHASLLQLFIHIRAELEPLL